MEKEEGKQKKRGNFLYLILLFLLVGSNAYWGWLWWNERGKFQIITIEKENVEKDAEIVKLELANLQAQYENLKANNAEMQTQIDEKKVEIEKLQSELEKHKGNAWMIAKLKKETETLRKIMQHFVHEIDSLNTLNKAVIADRENVRRELKTEKEKNVQLIQKNESLQETVNIASLLKPVGLSASAIISKRGGKKEVETSKAKKADKIKISFTLAENTVAKPGERIIYARIITPDGKELTQSEDELHTFQFGKSRGFWASKKALNYANENTPVLMYANPRPGENFVNGKYIIEVNCDNTTIGNAELLLE